MQGLVSLTNHFQLHLHLHHLLLPHLRLHHLHLHQYLLHRPRLPFPNLVRMYSAPSRHPFLPAPPQSRYRLGRHLPEARQRNEHRQIAPCLAHPRLQIPNLTLPLRSLPHLLPRLQSPAQPLLVSKNEEKQRIGHTQAPRSQLVLHLLLAFQLLLFTTRSLSFCRQNIANKTFSHLAPTLATSHFDNQQAATTASLPAALDITTSRPGISIPHHVLAPFSPKFSAGGFGSVDNILPPDAFSLSSTISSSTSSPDLWWRSNTDLPSSLFDHDSLSSSSSLSAASIAARRRLDRASSSSSSSMSSSSTYLSDSTTSTAISSIVIDEDSPLSTTSNICYSSSNSSSSSSSASIKVESEISDMIHRLITGNSEESSRNMASSGDDDYDDELDELDDADDDDDDELLFASVHRESKSQGRAISVGPKIGSRIDPNKKKDPLHQLFAMSASSKLSTARLPSTELSSSSEHASTTGATQLNRSASEPASITIPAEKNSYEDDDTDFIISRELLVRKGVVVGQGHATVGSSDRKSSNLLHGVVTDNSIRGFGTHSRSSFFAVDDDADVISGTTDDSNIMELDDTEVLFGGGLGDLGLLEDNDPFTFLDVIETNGSNEVVESSVGF
ncbi:hypothetical protein V1514DRAFT_325515 [Lipomyces japonicus]|uniref:uncharacterized protein n=1 Tax=Lipomyces japonicus TaxID=56871 RepID=UPI0034CE5F65